MLVLLVPYIMQKLLITNNNWCQTVGTQAVQNANMNSQLAFAKYLSSYAYIYFRLLHANGNWQKKTLWSDRQHFKMSILFMYASTFQSETAVASLIFEHSLFVCRPLWLVAWQCKHITKQKTQTEMYEKKKNTEKKQKRLCHFILPSLWYVLASGRQSTWILGNLLTVMPIKIIEKCLIGVGFGNQKER